MGKMIRLTIDDLKKIITECLDAMRVSDNKGENKSYNDIINYNLYGNGYLTEMALHKDEFIDLILNLKDQLVENWCLCAYCSLYDNINPNYEHWCSEFSSYANKIKRCNIKSGNKQKMIFITYIDKYDLNDSDMIYRIIHEKLIKEQIDEHIIRNLCEYFAQNAKLLTDYLSNNDYETQEYIMRTFELANKIN